MIFNAHSETIKFTLPGEQWGKQWVYVLDTARDSRAADPLPLQPEQVVKVVDRSFVLLQRTDT
jgi:glycogen operon protein